MATLVTGELKEGLLDQLYEIERQIRQSRGYPFDPTLLRSHLQEGIEGRFIRSVVSAVEGPPEPQLDFIIRVDRRVKPAYPSWSDKVMYPELQGTGPAEYDLKSDVEEWRHDEQKTGVVKGDTIYEFLKKDDALATSSVSPTSSPFRRRASRSSAPCSRARLSSAGSPSCGTAATAASASRASASTAARWCWAGAGWPTSGTPTAPLSDSASRTLNCDSNPSSVLPNEGLFSTQSLLSTSP